jgi:hypothetical protein
MNNTTTENTMTKQIEEMLSQSTYGQVGIWFASDAFTGWRFHGPGFGSAEKIAKKIKKLLAMPGVASAQITSNGNRINFK